jgi:hypothetical protein
MSSTPTLQALAIEARDAFGEDGTPRTTSSPTSFDVVVEVYAGTGHDAPTERVDRLVCAALTQALTESEEAPVGMRQTVPSFVSRTLHYLRAQYPEPETVQQDQRLLSTLFWGHLVEARHAWRRSR